MGSLLGRDRHRPGNQELLIQREVMTGEWLPTEVAGARVLARTVSRSGGCLGVGGGRTSEALAALSARSTTAHS